MTPTRLAVSAADGYGQWGLTEENGGVILSTTGFVFEAGLYSAMVQDFAVLVDATTSMDIQLDAGAEGTQFPLLENNHTGCVVFRFFDEVHTSLR